MKKIIGYILLTLMIILITAIFCGLFCLKGLTIWQSLLAVMVIYAVVAIIGCVTWVITWLITSD